MSGGIARDRSTTAQRSRQGSKTAAGRKRSPRERADLDGENGVVAWVDTASPAFARQGIQQRGAGLGGWPGRRSGPGGTRQESELSAATKHERPGPAQQRCAQGARR